MAIKEITNRINHAFINPTEDRMQLLVIVVAVVDDMNVDSTDPSLMNARWYVKVQL